MLRFFRRIRQNLLQENKFSKYLLYALGEILLVVIGILIALQINNWNEERKARDDEKATIRSLKLEFEKNLTDLGASIENVRDIKAAGELLLQHTGPGYTDGDINADSLISFTQRMVVWDPSLYTLSSIKNSGQLATLSNEELKLKLIEWESFYANLVDWCDFYVDGGEKYFQYLEENSIGRNFTAMRGARYGNSSFPGTNEALLREISFENKLVGRVTVNRFLMEFYEEAATRIEAIIELCQQYEE
ncbi:hypothetical protein SAMN04490243_0891 [Robiginitalea myxolifaciens]|uniref:Uncharacterized protein n=1 Tax=Robiginitalea myxolifaciens TaxID=400055 RepID=A0A1I6FY22_9FLAO|nr:DUF6090 family protein [Robiginitalea myxolifaciens]SFR34816.1 hypothetical protein SAMN04490243_0891 [Robiginitalea myxolifaciens]